MWKYQVFEQKNMNPKQLMLMAEAKEVYANRASAQAAAEDKVKRLNMQAVAMTFVYPVWNK